MTNQTCKKVATISRVGSDKGSVKALWSLLIWSIMLAPLGGPIVDPRDFSAGFGGNLSEEGLSLSAGLFRAFGTYWLFAVFLIILVHGTRTNAIGGKKPRALVFLWFTALTLAILPILSTLMIKPSVVKLGDLIMLLIFSSSFFLKPVDVVWWMKKVRTGLLVIYVYGSLLAVIIAPNWALLKDYDFSLTLFSFRLYGVSAHPNSLAPLAAVFIILGWYSGVQLRGESFHKAAALLVLLLTQAKTTWICFLLVLLVKQVRNLLVHRAIRTKYAFAAFIGACFAIFLSLLYGNKIYAIVIDKLSDPEVITLTGRLPVWILTVEAWLERPWLGIGLTLWDNDMRMEFSRINKEWTPNTAHSQFFQSLGMTGLIGLFALLVYFYLLAKVSVRLRTATDWLSVYLVTFAIVRSFTEVWIRVQGDTNFVLSWTIFAFLILYMQNGNGDMTTNVAPS